jgi:lysophospholipase L1-like esterase
MVRESSNTRKFIFSAIIVFVFFVLLEGGLRLTHLDRLGPEKAFENIFDPSAIMLPGAYNPYHFGDELISEKGFRGPNFKGQKPADTFRIICIGDSTTYGNDAYKQAYPTVLQKMLDNKMRHLTQTKYEVINAGVPGTGIYQQKLFFEKYFANVQFDMVVIMTGKNERDDLRIYREQMRNTTYRQVEHVQSTLSNFALYRFARHLIAGRTVKQVLDDFQIHEKDAVKQIEFSKHFFEDLFDLLLLSRQWDFYLVFLGSFDQATMLQMEQAGISSDNPNIAKEAATRNISSEIQFFCKTNNLNFVQYWADFIRHKDRLGGLWFDPNHANGFGNMLIAKSVADLIVSGDFPPKPLRPIN